MPPVIARRHCNSSNAAPRLETANRRSERRSCARTSNEEEGAQHQLDVPLLLDWTSRIMRDHRQDHGESGGLVVFGRSGRNAPAARIPQGAGSVGGPFFRKEWPL